MRDRAHAFAAASAAITMLCLLPATASAAPPGNDDFADAQSIGLGTVSGTTAEATIEEPDEPDHVGPPIGPAVASVWYEWSSGSTPPEHIRLSTCDPDSFTAWMTVYEGEELAALAPVGHVHGSCRVTLSPAPNTTYRIAVYSVFDPGPFELELRLLNPPANDDFEDATALGASLPRPVTGTTFDATAESGEPNHGGSDGTSVWYTWTPAADVRTKIELCGPDGPSPGVAVYTGTSLASLDQLAESSGPFDCSLNFDASGGETYRIAVDSGSIDGGVGGPFSLNLRELTPPPNDDLVNAEPIPAGLPRELTANRQDATREADEPFHGLPGPGVPTVVEASVWYSWESGAEGGEVVVANVCATELAVVAVYAGSAYTGPGALTPVAPNNGRCRQRFTTAPFTHYSVAVDGAGEGDVDLELHELDPPPNDDLADAQEIVGPLPQSISGTNVDATVEAGEPNHFLNLTPPEPSVWYAWNSGPGGEMAVDACAPNRGLVGTAVYTGSAYPLTLVAGQNFRCRQRFTAAPMTTYLIAVASDKEAEFALAIRFRDPPDNDDFADAQTLPSSAAHSVEATNFDATPEAGEPSHDPFGGGAGPRASVWYEWTAPAQPAIRSVTVDTCATDFDSGVAVYTGTGVQALTEVGEAFGCPSTTGDFGNGVNFQAVAGQTYKIAVDGWGGSDEEGTFTLALNATPDATPSGVVDPPVTPVKKKCKKGRKLKKGKCVKKRGKKRR